MASALVVSLIGLTNPNVANAASCTNYITERVNSYRAEHSVHSLKYSSYAASWAVKHSRRMAASGTIYHSNYYRSEYRAFLNYFSPFRALGENVGMGSDCQAIESAFESSPEHRSNILEKDYIYIGVGVASDGGSLYITQEFWTPRYSIHKASQQGVPHVVPRVIKQVHHKAQEIGTVYLLFLLSLD